MDKIKRILIDNQHVGADLTKKSNVARLKEDISRCLDELPEFVQEAAGNGAADQQRVIQALYQVAAQLKRHMNRSGRNTPANLPTPSTPAPPEAPDGSVPDCQIVVQQHEDTRRSGAFTLSQVIDGPRYHHVINFNQLSYRVFVELIAAQCNYDPQNHRVFYRTQNQRGDVITIEMWTDEQWIAAIKIMHPNVEFHIDRIPGMYSRKIFTP